MDYLLDTHTLLWAIYDNPNIPEDIKNILRDKKNGIYFSVASLWELQIKHFKNPELMPYSVIDIVTSVLDTKLELLDIAVTHLNNLQHIIPQNIHKDPFDHLLLATARSENMIILTHDQTLKHYQGVNVLAY